MAEIRTCIKVCSDDNPWIDFCIVLEDKKDVTEAKKIMNKLMMNGFHQTMQQICLLQTISVTNYQMFIYGMKSTFLARRKKKMSDLTRLFKVGQKVKCNMDGKLHSGIVKETFTDHIIVDVPDISDHCWFGEGFNMDCVYPEYNF